MTVIFKGREVVDIELDGIDSMDYPDFCDAYICYTVYEGSGEPLTDEELIQLTEEHGDLVNELAYESFH